MTYLDEDYKSINKRIHDAFSEEWELPPEVCRDVAFHMTDWLDDYEELGKVFDTSQNLSKVEVTKIVFGFLIHASNHIAAAKKLVGGGPMEDIFQVGIFEEDKIEEVTDEDED